MTDLKFVPTTCPYCGTGCSFNLVVKDGKIVGTAPSQRSPVNEGKLCPKGIHAYEFINSPDRLTQPLIRKNGELVPVSWDEATSYIAENMKKYQPSERCALSSARVSNEDNYAMMKFARGVLKTNHIDHCARLCHSSTVAGLAGSFGSGAMTNSITDISEAKCVFIIGSNTFEQHPLIGRREVMAKQNGAKYIYADPRRTHTCGPADLFLQFHSGTDVALLNGLMQIIIKNGWENKEFVEKRTKGYEELKAIVMKDEYSVENVAKVTGLNAKDIETAADWIANSGATALIYSMGITQHTVGVDNVHACANLQMLTGNLGRPGTGVNPLRGQNNVQGACDMGALPVNYTGYQKVVDPANHKKFEDAWKFQDGIAPAANGYEVTVMMNVLTDNPGELKAMYIMGENPLLSDPDLNHVKEAFENLEFVVVQDIFYTETCDYADVILPAVCFAERDGTQTNTERRVQRWHKAANGPGETKDDWEILAMVAAKMGYADQFAWKSASEVFDEMADLTPQYHGMNYERLEEADGLHWPCKTPEDPGTPILHKEKFLTADGLAVFYPADWKPPAEVPDAEYPLQLTTGRCLFHWHTGTMTRRSETLDKEVPTGWIEINSEDAKELGIRDGEMVRAVTRRDFVTVAARVTSTIKKGTTFMPFHFIECPANLLTNNALDPVCKIPEYKACATKIEKISKEA